MVELPACNFRNIDIEQGDVFPEQIAHSVAIAPQPLPFVPKHAGGTGKTYDQGGMRFDRLVPFRSFQHHPES